MQDDVADVVAQSLFVPLQDNFRFFRHPMPAIPLMFLAVIYLMMRRITGLPRSAYVTMVG